MHGKTSIFLIGPMGAGKSAVGRKLAEELQLEFVDSDEVIEARTGVDIPYIFEREGESGFRARERQVIDELTQLPGIVLATGGGAVQDAGQPRAPWLRADGSSTCTPPSTSSSSAPAAAASGRCSRAAIPARSSRRLMAMRDPQYRRDRRRHRRDRRPARRGRHPRDPPAG